VINIHSINPYNILYVYCLDCVFLLISYVYITYIVDCIYSYHTYILCILYIVHIFLMLYGLLECMFICVDCLSVSFFFSYVVWITWVYVYLCGWLECIFFFLYVVWITWVYVYLCGWLECIFFFSYVVWITWVYVYLCGWLECMIKIHSSNPYCLLNYTQLNHYTKLNHY